MSASGGVSLAVTRARVHGCEALQVFTKNASQWKGAPLATAEVDAFRQAIAESGIHPVVSHASYLINLATTAPALRAQSVDAFVDELDRAEALGLLGVVIHPGTCTAGTEEEGLKLIADGLAEAFVRRPDGRTLVLLEHTAGQGRTLGYRFEHLATILGHLDGSPRVGVCLDTCHLLASGYDLVNEDGYSACFESFGDLVGFDRLKVFHGNDSKKPCGSRVDRHEHIGKGHLGEAPFRRLLHDARFADLPILLETEKTPKFEKAALTEQDPLDAANLDTLRRLRA
jgi:deoxyribonuclease-4